MLILIMKSTYKTTFSWGQALFSFQEHFLKFCDKIYFFPIRVRLQIFIKLLILKQFLVYVRSLDQ